MCKSCYCSTTFQPSILLDSSAITLGWIPFTFETISSAVLLSLRSYSAVRYSINVTLSTSDSIDVCFTSSSLSSICYHEGLLYHCWNVYQSHCLVSTTSSDVDALFDDWFDEWEALLPSVLLWSVCALVFASSAATSESNSIQDYWLWSLSIRLRLRVYLTSSWL